MAVNVFDNIKHKYNICASHCCVCHRKLDDPSSIEVGIGPICRRSYHYEDAPVLNTDQVLRVRAALNDGFPAELSTELTTLVRVNSGSDSRQLAKCVVYYASSLVGTNQSCVHCVRILFCLGYYHLASRLLFKSYQHDLIHSTDDIMTFKYKGPFNATINTYLKNQFKGRWYPKDKLWMLEGSWIDCLGVLIDVELGKLSALPMMVQKPEIPSVVIQLNVTDAGIEVKSPSTFGFKEALKCQLNAKWDPQFKLWIVSTDYYEQLCILVGQYFPHSQIIK
jgi:hypothetical protein